jgi:hypothetical protein
VEWNPADREASLWKESGKYLGIASLGIKDSDGLTDDEAEGHSGNENHQQGSVSKGPDDQSLKNGTENTGHSRRSYNQKRDRQPCWQGREEARGGSNSVENENNETPKDADVTVGEMDHIQSTEKEAETNGD